MNRINFALITANFCLWISLSTVSLAQPSDAPKPIPGTRSEMLSALEQLKSRQPRIPLPDAAKSGATVASGAGAATPAVSPTLGVVNNGLMRSHYLPAELQTRRTGPGNANGQEIPYDFATELFWIVSRLNNCHYCLGHQEAKLAAVGVDETARLALDVDWSVFSAKQQAAFAFTRKLTNSPHAMVDADIAAMRSHFSDAEILEIAFLIGRYNSTNRWTDGLGIPQETGREFSTTLDAAKAQTRSQVLEVEVPPRIRYADFASWKAAFDKEMEREPRLLPPSLSTQPSVTHSQLLGAIPAAGEEWVSQLKAAQAVGKLSKPLRDKIAYVAARCDDAWYMQGIARERLLSQGLSEEDVFRLADNEHPETADELAIQFAKKLTVNPQGMTDADVASLKAHFSDHQIAEIVYHTGLASLLNRVTEVARIRR